MMRHTMTSGSVGHCLCWRVTGCKVLGSLLTVLACLCLVQDAAHAQTGNTAITVTYVYTNAQGTPLAKANAQGNIIARYTYRPYGTQQSGPTNSGPGYTGHVHDLSTGLVYMQQRYYDPEVGRFISPDPVAPAPGNVFNIGRYTYANNNPARFTDPNGRNATAFIGGLFIETTHLLTGRGFDGAPVVGALKDGYNGEGGGVLHAALQDAGTLSAVVGVGGAIKGAAAVVGRLVAKQAIKEGAEIGAKGLGNSFKGKTAAQVEKMFKGRPD